MTLKNTDTQKIKLIEGLNKWIPKAGNEVGAEIRKFIEVIRQEGYKLPSDEDFTKLEGRIIKEIEKKVANRKRYAPYGNMKAEELVRAWCSRPELRIEFDSNFQWFVSCIIENFPDSPVQWIADKLYVREYPQENLDRMIRDYEQKQANEQKKEGKTKTSGEAGDASMEKGRNINIQNSNVILGDVQHAENLQIGNNLSIREDVRNEEKKICILKRIPYWIYILALFFAALLTCLFYLGWLEPIKAFIYRIVLHR
jgi:hypothetical protein